MLDGTGIFYLQLLHKMHGHVIIANIAMAGLIKFCANAIAPVLQIIYTQSLEQATAPQE